MYVIERKNKFIETLVLKDKGKELKVEVNIELLRTLNRYLKATRVLEIAQIEIQKGGKDFGKLGNAILEVMEIVFGNEKGKEIIDFYDGDYAELLLDIYPFITNVVTPAYMEAKKQREKEIKQRIKRL